MKGRKSWTEKLDNPELPKVVEIAPNRQKRFGSGFMLIPSPREVEAVVKSVPRGETITVGDIRDRLAKSHSADVTCPLMTGMFLRITAEAAEEQAANGVGDIAPYWRVVKDDGSLNRKFPGGVEGQAAKLRAEGHRVEKSRLHPG